MTVQELLEHGDVGLALDLLGIEYIKTPANHFSIISWKDKATLNLFCSHITNLLRFGSKYGHTIRRKSHTARKYKRQGYISVMKQSAEKYSINVEIKLNKTNDNLQ